MSYKVTIVQADDTEKEFTVGSDVDLPAGLGLNSGQVQQLLMVVGNIANLAIAESWKSVEVEIE